MTSNVTAIILLLLSIASFFWGISPQKDNWTSLRATVAAREEALEQAKKVRTIRESLLERRRSITDGDMEKLGKLLPDSVDTIRLTRDLQGIAAQYGIIIKKIDIIKDTPTSRIGSQTGALGPSQQKYETLGISFAMSASYASFLSFLKDLEKSLRIIDITSTAIQANPNNKSGDMFDFTVGGRTYSLKDQ